MIKIYLTCDIKHQPSFKDFFFVGVSLKNLVFLEESGIIVKTFSKERNVLLHKIKNDLINLDKNIENVASPIWLSSNLAENNLCLENFSIYVLNILLIINHILPEVKMPVLICDDEEQVFIYSSILRKNGFAVESNIKYLKLFIKLLGCLYQKILYLILAIGKIIYLRTLRFINKSIVDKQKLKNLDVLCINWVNENSFKNNNLYLKDRYFGDLLSGLCKSGLKVELVGKTLDFTTSFKSIVKSAVNNKNDFYLFQDFIKINNLLKIFVQSFTFLKYFRTSFFVDGVNFSILWRWFCIKDTLKPRILYAMEVYYASKNLFKYISNYKIKLLYPYENQPWEKTLMLAFKEIFNSDQAYAYQHFPVSSDYLTAYPSNVYVKKKLAPKILLSDRLFGEELTKNNFNEYFLLGNYRLKQSLAMFQENSKIKFKDSKIILCSCPIQMTDSLELVLKSIKIINLISPEILQKISFVINFHPYMSNTDKTLIRKISDRCKIKIIFSPLIADEILPNTTIVFYNSNSICFNAAAMGIPAIFVSSDFLIDVDRIPEVSIKAGSAQATAKIVEKLFDDKTFYQEQSDKFKMFFDTYYIEPQISVINSIFNNK